MVRDNCLELEVNFVEEVQKQVQAIKQRALNIEVIIQIQRYIGVFSSRTYCIRRTSTVGFLKTQFLVDIGLANEAFNCVLVDPFSLRELKNDNTLMEIGLRDGAVLHVRGKMSMPHFFQPFPTALSQYSSTQVSFQIAVPRAVTCQIAVPRAVGDHDS